VRNPALFSKELLELTVVLSFGVLGIWHRRFLLLFLERLVVGLMDGRGMSRGVDNWKVRTPSTMEERLNIRTEESRFAGSIAMAVVFSEGLPGAVSV
jgi:hypothetical protein